MFADGHDEVRAPLTWRGPDRRAWQRKLRWRRSGNDRWAATFGLPTVGRYEFKVTGSVDHYATWEHDLEKRVAAGQDVTVDELIGEQILRARRQRGEAEPLTESADLRGHR